MNWSAAYVGLPFLAKGRCREGLDCWGLARLVMAEVSGISLPSYAEAYAGAEERDEIAAALSGGKAEPQWLDVLAGQERPLDLAVFRRAGLDAHVGVVVKRGSMLHVQAGHESRIDRYDTGRWQPRLSGFYRHAEAACPT